MTGTADQVQETPTAEAAAAPEAGAVPAQTEQEMLEAAAAAEAVTNSTTVQRAMNVMEAAVIQRQAISEAYEAQKAAIEESVVAQRAATMQQIAQAKSQQSQLRASETMRDAQQATRNMTAVARDAFHGAESEAVAVAADEAAPQAAAADAPDPALPAPTPAPAPQAAQVPAQPAAPTYAGQPPAAPQQALPYEPDLSPSAPVMKELVKTIRSIINEEVDAQLKALLAAHVGDGTQEAAAEDADKPSS